MYAPSSGPHRFHFKSVRRQFFPDSFRKSPVVAEIASITNGIKQPSALPLPRRRALQHAASNKRALRHVVCCPRPTIPAITATMNAGVHLSPAALNPQSARDAGKRCQAPSVLPRKNSPPIRRRCPLFPYHPAPGAERRARPKRKSLRQPVVRRRSTINPRPRRSPIPHRTNPQFLHRRNNRARQAPSASRSGLRDTHRIAFASAISRNEPGGGHGLRHRRAPPQKLAIGRVFHQRLRMASRVKSKCTNCDLRKRTSIFAGCTLRPFVRMAISRNSSVAGKTFGGNIFR